MSQCQDKQYRPALKVGGEPQTSSQITDTLSAALAVLHTPGHVFEIRIPHAGRRRTVAGWFDEPETAAQAAREYDGAHNVYVTLNPCASPLLARAHNRLKPYTQQTTADSDIAARQWLLVDCDPVRPAGISSTDGEKQAAWETAAEVRAYLNERDWPAPVVADSGNGYHLLYSLELTNDAPGRDLVKAALDGLAAEFSGPAVSIDTGVFNAARIVKLYGTMAVKGDHTPDRPHRRSSILDVPEHFVALDPGALEALADQIPEPPPAAAERMARKPGNGFDLQAFMARRGLAVRREKPWNGGTLYKLEACPFNPEHNRGEAAITQGADGRLGFSCKHNSCQDKDWRALRSLLEPEHGATAHKATSISWSAPSKRATIYFNRSELNSSVAQCVDALTQAGAEIFDRCGVLVHPVRTESLSTVAGVRRPAGSMMLKPVEQTWLRLEIDAIAEFLQFNERKKEYIPRDVPKPVLESICGVPEWFSWAKLRAVARHPVLTLDGRRITSAGLDVESGIYVDIEGFWPEIPPNPTQHDAGKALERIHSLLQHFPFDSDESRAVVVAMMITSLFRGLLPTAPGFALDANRAGTGKSLLANACSLIASGREAAFMGYGSKNEESEKRIDSALLAGDPIVVVDNVERPLEGNAICIVLTQTQKRVRDLGFSRLLDAPTTSTMIFTGNNLTITGDAKRRILKSRMVTEEERPELREISQDLSRECLERRGELVRDLQTIIAAHIEAGAPRQNLHPFGSFEDWNHAIRHAMVWAGSADPVTTIARTFEEDPARESDIEVLAAWHQRYSNEYISIKKALEDTNEDDTFREALCGVCEHNGVLDPNRLGNWFRKNRDATTGVYTVRRSPTQTRGLYRWSVTVATREDR